MAGKIKKSKNKRKPKSRPIIKKRVIKKKTNVDMERRRYARFPAIIEANIYYITDEGRRQWLSGRVTGLLSPDGSARVEAEVANLSQGGVYLKLVEPVPAGKFIVVELFINGAKTVRLVGVVRWSKALKNDEIFKYSAGVMFLYMGRVEWDLLKKRFNVK